MVHSNSQWLKLSQPRTLQHLHGVVQASDGSVWIQHAHDDARQSGLLRCDADGIEREWLTHDLVQFPHGLEIYIHPTEGECLLVTDTKTGLSLFRFDGSLVWHLAKPALYRLRWTLAWAPSNTAIAHDGRIFLADGYGTGFISIISPDGSDGDCFAGPSLDGTGAVHPHGLAVGHYDGMESIIVGECQLSSQDPAVLNRFQARSCLKIYDLNGVFMRSVACDCISPRHLRREAPGRWLMPDFQGRLLRLDESLTIQASIGTEDDRFTRPCDHPYDMPRPHDCCVLSNGSIVVTDYTGVVHHITGWV